MGTILAFRRDDEAAVPLANPVRGSLGEIIIFPGVRIERTWDTIAGLYRTGDSRRATRPRPPQEVGRLIPIWCRGRRTWP